MVRSYYAILAAAILTMAAVGCVETAVIEPPDERTVIVKCILMNDTVQQVSLNYSAGINERQYEPVKEAEVFIDGPGHGKIYFEQTGDGKWKNGFQPQNGALYTLNVLIPGRDPIKATTTFPDAFSISSYPCAPARWLSDSKRFVEEHGYNSNIVPRWLGYLRNYIPGWEEAISNGTIHHSSMIDYDVLSKIAENQGTTIHQTMPGMAFRMESDSKVRLYILGTVTDSKGRVSRIRLLGSDHRNLDLSNSLKTPFRPGITADEAYVPLEYSIHNDDVMNKPANRAIYDKAALLAYEGRPICSDYLRILTDGNYDSGRKFYSIDILDAETDNTKYPTDPHARVNPPYSFPAEDYKTSYNLILFPAARSFFSVYGDFFYNIWGVNETPDHPTLYFCSLSEEYDRYLQDLRNYTAETEGDLLSFIYAEEKLISSNIEGGKGIFGAVSVLRHDCDLHFNPRATPLHPDRVTEWYSAYPAYPAALPEL